MSTAVGTKGRETSKTQRFGNVTRRVTRIIIVSPDTLLRAGLRAILGAVPEYRPIVEASTIALLRHRSRKGRPELVLVDVSAGLPDGLEELRQSIPDIQIVAFSSHDDSEMLRRCLKAGVHGVVTYTADDLGALFDVLDGVRRRGFAVCPRSLIHLIRAFCGEEPSLLDQPLAPREREILKLMADGSSNKQIAKQLYVSEGTVKNYVSSILRKLGVRSRGAAIARSAATPEKFSD